MQWLYFQNMVGTATAIFCRIGAILIGIVLCGCAQTGGLQPPIAPTLVGPEKALAFVAPGSFDTLTIVQKNYANAVEQQIFLRTDAHTPGQNYMKVSYWGPADSRYEARERLPYIAFQRSRLEAEMRADFPSIPMSTSPDYLQNSYGAFSYAVGKGAGNDLCFYGWQQVRTADENRAVFGDTGMIQVRLRLCQAGATQNTLLSVMYHYTLTGAFQSPFWNPYGAPPALAGNIGMAGQPIYPIGQQSVLDRPAAAKVPALTVNRPAASVQSVAKREPQPLAAPASDMAPVLRPDAAIPQVPAPPIVTNTMGDAYSRSSPDAAVHSPTCAEVRKNSTCN